MDSAAPNLLVTPQQYLTFEEGSSERHEYVDGLVYAMPGESLRHNEIAGNLYSLLRSAARSRKCRVAFEGVKLSIPSVNRNDTETIVAYADTVEIATPAHFLMFVSSRKF